MTAVAAPLRGESDQTAPAAVVRWKGGASCLQDDWLAREEPLEIRLAGCSVTVTMRTPGHDFDLAAGFLYTEGIIHASPDIASLAHCPADDGSVGNIVNVNPSSPTLVLPDRLRRNFYASASCGLCGSASIEAIRRNVPVRSPAFKPRAAVIAGLDARLRSAQTVFDATGGLHAAGIFDASERLLVVREDIGRHNAVDKAIGALLREGVTDRTHPLRDHILLVSGRASFEIVQKAAMAGLGAVAAVSAPSSLAVELAAATGIVLIGFLRGDKFNIYAGETS